MIICCAPAERFLRALVWIAFGVFGAIPKFLYTVFVVLPILVVLRIVQKELHELIGGAIVGAVLSYGVFLPLASESTSYPSGVCSVYIALISWVLGEALVTTLILFKLIRALTGEVSRETWLCAFRQASAGSTVGLLLGLAAAMSITAFEHPVPAERVPFDEWCRPHDDAPVFWLAAGASLIGALSALVVPTGRRARNRGRRRAGAATSDRSYLTRSGPPKQSRRVYYGDQSGESDQEDSGTASRIWGDSEI